MNELLSVVTNREGHEGEIWLINPKKPDRLLPYQMVSHAANAHEWDPGGQHAVACLLPGTHRDSFGRDVIVAPDGLLTIVLP